MANPVSCPSSLTGSSDWVHIPTPGDHYSPATGSAVITVIAALARRQTEEGGGTPVVLVSKGTQEGYPPYAAGKTLEGNFPGRPLTLFQKLADVMLGSAAGTRPFTSRLYRQMAQSLPMDFSGVLFVHNQPAAILPLRRLFPQATLVLYAHNDSFGTYSSAETAKFFKAVSLVICCSRFLADVLKKKSPPDGARKIKVLLNGVDTNKFAPVQKDTRPQGTPLKILFVGRMLPEKGPHLLLQAATLLERRRREGLLPPFQVSFVGSSNFNASDPLTRYESSLRKLAFPLGGTVEFHSFAKRDAIPAVYQAADIFVAPSNWDEPFGLTVAEAMSSGLPCIVSKRGGIPEAAAEAALYFTPPNPGQIADHLQSLLTNPQARLIWGERARARALELSWESRFKRLQRIIRENGPSESLESREEFKLKKRVGPTF